MTKNQLKTKRGFTIIEVVLVLAIAGLIFMMVFLALPALQRSQRDRQRQNDMSRLVATITEYQSNNRGQVPATDKWNDFKDSYLGGDDGFSGPNNEYSINTGKCTSGANATCSVTGNNTTTTPGDERVYIFYNAACGESTPSDDPTDAVTTASPNSTQELTRKLAVVIRMEGSGVLYCNTN